MQKFVLWFGGYEYLADIFDLATFSLYLIVAFFVFKVHSVFVLRFLNHRFIEERRKRVALHGSAKDHSTGKKILAVTMGPIIEEIGFRGPVLWFVLKEEYATAFWACIISAVLFSLVHLVSREKYEDGTKLFMPKVVLVNAAFGGVLFGLTTIATGSLWPAILAHTIWNNYIVFVYPRLNKKEVAQAV